MTTPKIENLRKKVKRQGEVLATLVTNPKSHRSELFKELDTYLEVKATLDSEQVKHNLEDPNWRAKVREELAKLVDPEMMDPRLLEPEAAEPVPEKA